MTPLDAVTQAEQRRISVAVAASDEVVRHRAVRALARDGHLVSAQAPSCEVLEVEDPSTDVVVIASVSSAEDQVAAIQASKARLPRGHIVIIASAGPNGVHRAFEAGADGFVLDRDVEVALGPTVRAVCAGQVVVAPVMRASVLRPALTHREKQTLGLLVLGLTNAEIAHRLFLAESTVKCHMTSVFSKLGVRSRSEAAARVLDPHYGLGMGVLRLSENGAEREMRP
jgi:DNA-binding NarL/FixJ family response regulator